VHKFGLKANKRRPEDRRSYSDRNVLDRISVFSRPWSEMFSGCTYCVQAKLSSSESVSLTGKVGSEYLLKWEFNLKLDSS
jgi:hypothetical protein